MSETDIEDAPPEDPPENITDPAIEDEARQMGWRPEEEFNGAGEWRGAEEFVERGKNINGILRKANEASAARVAELEATVGQLTEHMGKADERAHRRAIAEHQQAQREAVDEMDTAKFDRETQAINDLVPPSPPVQQSKDSPAFDAWKRDTSWYGKDIEMTIYAHQAAEVLIGQGHTAESPLHFKAVDEEMHRRFKDRFENPRRSSAPSVESGVAPVRRKADPHAYANVPADDQKIFERFVAEGTYKDTDADRKEYAAIYFEDDQ